MRNKNNKKDKRRLLKRYPLTVFAAVSLTLLLSFVAIFFNSAPTGMASSPPTVDVSVLEQFAGKITVFTYKNSVEIIDRQVIVTEFTNTGNVPYNSQTTVTVYYYNRSLEEEARFEDQTFLLRPGMRRGFMSEFIPTKTGDYYIKLRVAYQYKVAVAWGYFRVFMITGEEIINWTVDNNMTIIYNYTLLPPERAAPNIIEIPANARMALEYNDTIFVEKGSRIVVPVKVNNNGEGNLTNVKIYLSSPNMLYTDVNPKAVGDIAPGDSFTFLITMEPLPNITAGDYNVSFEALSGETSMRGSMTVSVVEKLAYHDWQSLKDLILSYNYIASELESKINYLSMYGNDVKAANITLTAAKAAIASAKTQYNDRDYEKCKEFLDIAGPLLENAALQIGHMTMKVYAAQPGLSYFVIAALSSGIVLAVFLIYRHEKKKGEKPKFLRATE